MPETITIGAVVYRVVERELDGTLCGDIDPMACRIRIRDDMHAQAQQVTLWHEVIHGILMNAGYRDHDEQQIDALAYGLVQVLRDNPEMREVNP